MGREGTTPDFRGGGRPRATATGGFGEDLSVGGGAILAPGRVAPAEREPGVRVMNADEVHGPRFEIRFKV